MKRIIFILLIFMIVSCNKRKTHLEKILIDNKWIYYPGERVKENIVFISYIKFYENHKCKNFYISSDIESNLLEGEENANTWDYDEENKTLKVFGNSFKILSVVNDTIFMQRSDVKVILFKFSD